MMIVLMMTRVRIVKKAAMVMKAVMLIMVRSMVIATAFSSLSRVKSLKR